jgi:hypothetical protein
MCHNPVLRMCVRTEQVFKQVVHTYNIYIHSFILSFIHQWLYSPLLGLGHFFSFVISFTQSVELLGRVIRPSQGRYFLKGQHKYRTNAHTDIHALSGIRTHDPSVRAIEYNSYLRQRGHRDRRYIHSSI